MTKTTSQEEWTMQELQAQISRLQSILHHKVCGDPTKGFSIPYVAEQEQLHGADNDRI